MLLNTEKLFYTLHVLCTAGFLDGRHSPIYFCKLNSFP